MTATHTMTANEMRRAHRLKDATVYDTKVQSRQQGVVMALVNVTGNRDSDGDVVLPGASDWGLTQVQPKGVWHHDWTTPIARTVDAKELYPGDPKLPGDLLTAGLGALRVEMQFNLDSENGKEAFSQVNFYGDEQQWSVGYEIVDAFRGLDPGKSWNDFAAKDATQFKAFAKFVDVVEPDVAQQAQFIVRWKVYEYSPVLFGSNDLARTEGVKSMTKTELTRLDRIEQTLERIVVHIGKDALDIEAHAEELESTAEELESTEENEEAAAEDASTDSDERDVGTESADGSDRIEEDELAEVKALELPLTNLEMAVNEIAGAKAGRVQARRNVSRIRSAMSALQEMLDELTEEEDKAADNGSTKDAADDDADDEEAEQAEDAGVVDEQESVRLSDGELLEYELARARG